MQVTAGNNSGNRAGYPVHVNANPNAPGTSVVVDMPFGNFVPNAGPPPDFRDIDLIDIISQSGSAVGANDYAITLIEAVQ